MLDYNNGEIHGWNGGDCPVHPESIVEVWFLGAGKARCTANDVEWDWTADTADIIAFRVVEQHVEPNTVWVNEYASFNTHYETEELAKKNAVTGCKRIAVEYREVKK